MVLISKQQLKTLDINLQAFDIQGNIFEEYPSVTKGYLFHFTMEEPIYNGSSFIFSLENHWKHSIYGNLESLSTKLDALKNSLLSVNENKFQDIDQFAYINLFIIPKEEQYELIISSDTFNVSKLIDLD